MAFCPTSNLFLGSGLFDLAKVEGFGVRVGLGTDVGGGTSFSQLASLNEAYKVLQLQGLEAVNASVLMPPAWQTIVAGPAVTRWELDTDGSTVRGMDSGIWRYYEVRETGALKCMQLVPAGASSAAWQQCCVVDVLQALHPEAQRLAQQRQQQQPTAQRPPQYYLVGTWDSIRVDPSVWGFGPLMGVLQYTVKGGYGRLLQAQCAQMPAWQPGTGVRPKLWTDSSGQLSSSAVVQLEAGQKRKFDELWTAPAGSSAVVRVSDQELIAVYDASWMHPSPERLLPRQREVVGCSRDQHG